MGGETNGILHVAILLVLVCLLFNFWQIGLFRGKRRGPEQPPARQGEPPETEKREPPPKDGEKQEYIIRLVAGAAAVLALILLWLRWQ